MESNYWETVTSDQVREAYLSDPDYTTTEVMLHFIDIIANVNLWDSKDFAKECQPFMWVFQQFNNLPFVGSFETLKFSQFIFLQETMKGGNALTCDFSKVDIGEQKYKSGTAMWQFACAYAFSKYCQSLPDRFNFLSDESTGQTPAFGVPSSPWFSTLYSLSDGDIYKSERISEMPCGFVFRWLSESERLSNKKGD